MNRTPEYSLRRGRLFYQGERITEDSVSEAREVRNKHVIHNRTEAGIYQALLFCVASQGNLFERCVHFMHGIDDRDDVSRLRDFKYLGRVAKKHGVRYWERLEPVLEWAGQIKGGVERMAENLLLEPQTVREQIVRDTDAKFLSTKTVSFWYYTLGGKDLMVIDRHNARQLYSIGLNVDPKYFDGLMRKSGKTEGKTVPATPSFNQYLRMEADAHRVLRNDPMLALGPRQPDLSLITTLFWVSEAKRARRIDALQLSLGDLASFGFACPYSESVSNVAEPIPDTLGNAEDVLVSTHVRKKRR